MSNLPVAGSAPLPQFLKDALTAKLPQLWLNPRRQVPPPAAAEAGLGAMQVQEAAQKLGQFARLLVQLFPETKPGGGIIESPLYAAGTLQHAMSPSNVKRGHWFIKGDHELPIAGSIKARGGVYEVLLHAENLALQSGVLRAGDERALLATSAARDLYSRHRIVVGSTGNLGLSIGVMATALGFRAVVHMSADAKEWKKVRLRSQGVEVIEHVGNYAAAVAAGRSEAQADRYAYFVDDERSTNLFLGYSAAAIRLQEQLVEQGISVDAQHPLFVYLPCGVGGAPGGVTFGLRHLFKEHVHCFFAEPVASPCMLVRLASTENRSLSVEDVGLDNRTEADGLAVGRASELVARLTGSMISGVFTVRDEDLFEDLYLLEQTMGLRIEPSAAAGLRGPLWLLCSHAGRQYLRDHRLMEFLDDATHILWTTGGSFAPDDEYRRFHERGRLARAARLS